MRTIIANKSELNDLLLSCRAETASLPRDGGKFYRVEAQDFRFPDGSLQTREYLSKRPASVVVPITEDGNYIFVVQPIALSKEGALIEFPAGYCEENEKGKEAAMRELCEETGYRAEKCISTGTHYQDPGSIRQCVETFVATNCVLVSDQKLDNGEYIRQIEVPRALAQELAEDGFFKDANTFIAFYKAEKLLG